MLSQEDNFSMLLSDKYQSVRSHSLKICAPLEIEDYLIQPMEDASPPKWHLAHTTWFFETFLLVPFLKDYEVFSQPFEFMFNSYYNGIGPQYPRSKRGLLSRPTLEKIIDYRAYVDRHISSLLDKALTPEIYFRITLGINHEQQHQELFFTDLKYNFGHNPLLPAYCQHSRSGLSLDEAMTFSEFDGGIYEIGANPKPEFCFDNETPRHQVLVKDFSLANRLVTNVEYLEFINDGGYERPELWLSDGWNKLSGLKESRWNAPLYWCNHDGGFKEYTLGGMHDIASDVPVCHVSAYEADAFARWKNCRLPTEIEWEIAANDQPKDGNFMDSQTYHPIPALNSSMDGLFGNLWEWTRSSYAPYPGFKSFDGQLGEYNGKFMANQLVLRGGSCVTPRDHIRITYRNFFYPADRWQFSGIRLASDD